MIRRPASDWMAVRGDRLLPGRADRRGPDRDGDRRPDRDAGAAAADRRRVSPGRSCPVCPRSSSSPTWCCSGCCRRCCTPPRCRPRWSTSPRTVARSCCSRSGLVAFTTAGVAVVDARAAARPRLAGRVRDRRRGGAARRGRRHRDRPPDRAAAPAGDDPRGRVAAQRRDRPGRAAHRDRGRRPGRRSRPAADRRRLPGRGRRWRAGRLPAVPASWRGCAQRVTDPLLDVGISLVVPFAAYVAAEKVQVGDSHASGVIAVVIAGLLLGHKAPVLQTARSRIAERTNWQHDRVHPREHRLPPDRASRRAGSSTTSATARCAAGRIAAVCARHAGWP